ncbi:hypothetical protein GLOIN_2v176264 [Rhizophagus irregularis DAOM 181602=DAOM 197198]|uniref:Uncharacterized protein n=1 Tax=Rhizophagus irregularis (strain DAOM 181602 / DAOM 197198 / MUCL 43194) TaxID=747089 RepID=A0A2P4PVM8_RHIID|nr:hypothetical protein GLOIN_2v176264 [Rhizophagus irregularis DAOM 181602=DAOM 197198]POG69434.1 hypothetical protein GLOIN_2v176264 [Rhizophagus irregularis DAOM 181602=DAOM 197198]|eukprot:XP_025176300.1 hypothetical protein GLOIN_2v176264 [Rhizophagus irregularis DAOM 181602=DAOM 197198]
MFGEIKPPHCLNTVNKSIIKLAEFMKGSLDLIINIYGYVAGLETYGILICGLYRFNLLSKVLFPTENANFLNIITVVSTLYSLLGKIYYLYYKFIPIINSIIKSPHPYYRKSNSSPKKIRVPIVRA